VLFDRGTPDLAAATDGLTLVQQEAQQPTLLNIVRVDGDWQLLDQSVELWICADTPHTPAVRMKLRELLELGAPRPLNVAVQRGEAVFVRLYAPTAQSGPLPTLRVEVLSTLR
jgi:hypothetical protein